VDVAQVAAIAAGAAIFGVILHIVYKVK
jgi:hypothetical protein